MNIIEKLKERQKKKTNINVTIDVKLFEAIDKFKKENGIEQLSPLINEMLWEFINKQKEEEAQE